jgi:putative ABC transport system ATP-binding protein/lipoprotein-releasing system ATP-binding protein
MRVSVAGLSQSFPGTGPLFADVSFVLEAGDLVGLTGPSGSGTSTMLSLLARWEKATTGTVLWDGVASVGWVFQNPHGVAARTAVDHVALPLLNTGLSRRAATAQAMALMERFDLAAAANRRFSALSGGEAQRLMLARAMARRPDLLLVDEPTAQLDARSSATVNAVLGQLADQRTIVVVATHDPDTAASCRRVLDLAHGWAHGSAPDDGGVVGHEHDGVGRAEPGRDGVAGGGLMAGGGDA